MADSFKTIGHLHIRAMGLYYRKNVERKCAMHLRTVIKAVAINAKHHLDGATNPVQLVIVTREWESKNLDGTFVPAEFPEEFMKGFYYSNI